jgi:hypothetical protein
LKIEMQCQLTIGHADFGQIIIGQHVQQRQELYTKSM